MNDLISRKDAIDAVHEEFDECLVWDESGETTANEIERILDGLPSAQLERQTGRWIDIPHTFFCKCSECGWINDHDSGFKWCPDCGADMRGEENG